MGWNDGGVYDDLESDLKRKLKIEAKREMGGVWNTIGQDIFLPDMTFVCLLEHAKIGNFSYTVPKVPSNSSRFESFSDL